MKWLLWVGVFLYISSTVTSGLSAGITTWRLQSNTNELLRTFVLADGLNQREVGSYTSQTVMKCQLSHMVTAPTVKTVANIAGVVTSEGGASTTAVWLSNCFKSATTLASNLTQCWLEWCPSQYCSASSSCDWTDMITRALVFRDTIGTSDLDVVAAELQTVSDLVNSTFVELTRAQAVGDSDSALIASQRLQAQVTVARNKVERLLLSQQGYVGALQTQTQQFISASWLLSQGVPTQLVTSVATNTTRLATAVSIAQQRVLAASALSSLVNETSIAPFASDSTDIAGNLVQYVRDVRALLVSTRLTNGSFAVTQGILQNFAHSFSMSLATMLQSTRYVFWWQVAMRDVVLLCSSSTSPSSRCSAQTLTSSYETVLNASIQASLRSITAELYTLQSYVLANTDRSAVGQCWNTKIRQLSVIAVALTNGTLLSDSLTDFGACSDAFARQQQQLFEFDFASAATFPSYGQSLATPGTAAVAYVIPGGSLAPSVYDTQRLARKFLSSDKALVLSGNLTNAQYQAALIGDITATKISQANSPFTAECWFKLNSVPAVVDLFGVDSLWRLTVRANSTHMTFVVYILSQAGELLDANNYVTLAAVAVSTPTEWHHAALTVTAFTVQVALDGTYRDGFQRIAPTSYPAAVQAYLGGESGRGSFLLGQMDEMRFHSRLLRADELGFFATALVANSSCSGLDMLCNGGCVPQCPFGMSRNTTSCLCVPTANTMEFVSSVGVALPQCAAGMQRAGSGQCMCQSSTQYQIWRARYVTLTASLCIACTSDQPVGLLEVGVMDALGAALTIVGCTQQGSGVCSRLYDGDVTSNTLSAQYLATGVANALRVTLDLGQVRSISGVRVFNLNADNQTGQGVAAVSMYMSVNAVANGAVATSALGEMVATDVAVNAASGIATAQSVSAYLEDRSATTAQFSSVLSCSACPANSTGSVAPATTLASCRCPSIMYAMPHGGCQWLPNVLNTAPVFDTAAGDVRAGTVVHLNSSCSLCQIYYTLDGSTPDQYSMLYTSGIVLSAPSYTYNVRAVVVSSTARPSPEVSRTFVARPVLQPPVVSPPANQTFYLSVSVSLSSLDGSDVQIRYSLGGAGNITADSALYTTPLNIVSSTVLYARAFRADAFASDIIAARFNITYAAIASAVFNFSEPALIYNSSFPQQTVSLSAGVSRVAADSLLQLHSSGGGQVWFAVSSSATSPPSDDSYAPFSAGVRMGQFNISPVYVFARVKQDGYEASAPTVWTFYIAARLPTPEVSFTSRFTPAFVNVTASGGAGLLVLYTLGSGATPIYDPLIVSDLALSTSLPVNCTAARPCRYMGPFEVRRAQVVVAVAVDASNFASLPQRASIGPDPNPFNYGLFVVVPSFGGTAVLVLGIVIAYNAKRRYQRARAYSALEKEVDVPLQLVTTGKATMPRDGECDECDQPPRKRLVALATVLGQPDPDNIYLCERCAARRKVQQMSAASAEFGTIRHSTQAHRTQRVRKSVQLTQMRSRTKKVPQAVWCSRHERDGQRVPAVIECSTCPYPTLCEACCDYLHRNPRFASHDLKELYPEMHPSTSLPLERPAPTLAVEVEDRSGRTSPDSVGSIREPFGLADIERMRHIEDDLTDVDDSTETENASDHSAAARRQDARRPSGRTSDSGARPRPASTRMRAGVSDVLKLDLPERDATEPASESDLSPHVPEDLGDATDGTDTSGHMRRLRSALQKTAPPPIVVSRSDVTDPDDIQVQVPAARPARKSRHRRVIDPDDNDVSTHLPAGVDIDNLYDSLLKSLQK